MSAMTSFEFTPGAMERVVSTSGLEPVLWGFVAVVALSVALLLYEGWRTAQPVERSGGAGPTHGPRGGRSQRSRRGSPDELRYDRAA